MFEYEDIDPEYRERIEAGDQQLVYTSSVVSANYYTDPTGTVAGEMLVGIVFEDEHGDIITRYMDTGTARSLIAAIEATIEEIEDEDTEDWMYDTGE